MPAPSIVTLAYSVTATNAATADLQTAMQDVPLYRDPVAAGPFRAEGTALGEALGLSVASDVTSIAGNVVTRTIVLHMTFVAGAPYAPPFVFVGEVLTKDVPSVAFSSTSDQDGPGGTGARTIKFEWHDKQTNAGSVDVTLNGRTPVVVPLTGTDGVFIVDACFIETVGSFGTSVGRITLSEFSPPVPPLHLKPNEPLPDAAFYLGSPIGYLVNSYWTVAPTDALMVSTLTDTFTHMLSEALSTPVTAALPVLS